MKIDIKSWNRGLQKAANEALEALDNTKLEASQHRGLLPVHRLLGHCFSLQELLEVEQEDFEKTD